MTTLLWALIGGTTLGLLGKGVAPGDRDLVPLWLTIVAGIAGVFLGDFAYGLLWDKQTFGVDWWRHGWQLAGAALLVGIAASATGRRS